MPCFNKAEREAWRNGMKADDEKQGKLRFILTFFFGHWITLWYALTCKDEAMKQNGIKTWVMQFVCSFIIVGYILAIMDNHRIWKNSA